MVFKKKIGIPFRLTAAEERRYASFDFQDLFDGCYFNCQIGTVTWGAVIQCPFSGAADLENSLWFFFCFLTLGSDGEREDYQNSN